MNKRYCCLFAALALLAATVANSQSRVDFHLLPAVSSSPLDPDWSPDAQDLVYAARGDIWRIPVSGGSAQALTKGPAYYSEPAFSPDGEHVAVSMRNGDNLDIGVLDTASGDVERLTTDPEADFAPAWSADGTALYFVSRRSGNLDILRFDLASREITAVVAGPGHDYQPAVSPDGRQLAYVAPVAGRIGSGGIWVRDLPDGEPHLVHYEESSYRMKPQWTADGRVLAYSSDAAGSNDIAIVPAAGGNRVRLTKAGDDEFDPAVSPDGSRIAFVSNQGGPTQLHTMSLSGGADGDWSVIRIDSRKPLGPRGRLRGRVLDEHGQPVAARLLLEASDGRAYTEEHGFHRMVPATGTHYQHVNGSFEIDLPSGVTQVAAMRGFEYVPTSEQVEVPRDGVADIELRLERFDEPAARGWFSGDMHVHDLHEGRFGLTHEQFYQQLYADDLGVANALIHMDGTKIMGRWDDLTGEPHPLSSDTTILRYSQEFRGSFGHISLVGIDRFIMPMIAGTPNTPFAADDLGIRHVDEAHAQGGIAGFVHPYNHDVKTPQDAGRSQIPIVAAVAGVESYDVASGASREFDSVAVYYRLLNAGIRIAATGGTDNFSDVWFDPSGGTTRTYARLPDGQKLSYDHWLEAVAEGRTFASSGPLLYLDVNGQQPGDSIQLTESDADEVSVSVAVKSMSSLDSVELVANGEVVQSWDIAGGDRENEFSTTVSMPQGGWITARAIGPSSRFVGDVFAFAQTSPVYVTSDGQSFASPEDAAFLRDAVDELWRRALERNSWFSEAQRDTFAGYVQQARAFYNRVILLEPQSAPLNLSAPENFRVEFLTTEGPVVIDVHRSWSPIGVDRFYSLLHNGYYDNNTFFRVREKSFVQFGVHGDPQVAQAWRNQRIADDPVVQSNRRGTIGFAMGTAPNDRTSQLYINLTDKPELDDIGFSVFGEVVSGMESVDNIYSGYGEEAGGGIRRGQQDVLFEGGNAWLNANFPELDAIITATVTQE